MYLLQEKIDPTLEVRFNLQGLVFFFSPSSSHSCSRAHCRLNVMERGMGKVDGHRQQGFPRLRYDPFQLSEGKG